MACGSCGGGARAVERWIYTSPTGQRTEVSSETEANQLITINGGGSKARKPN